MITTGDVSSWKHTGGPEPPQRLNAAFLQLPAEPGKEFVSVTDASLAVPLKLNHSLGHSLRSTLRFHHHSSLSNVSEMSHSRYLHAPAEAFISLHQS